MKKLLLIVMFFTLLTAYDFGKIPEIRAKDITFGQPMMIMVGKTNCVWCESMAPQLKEIKEEYPNTLIYYMNSDIEPMWAIKHHILELPVQIFYDSRGEEIGRHTGYINKNDILELLKQKRVLRR
jgi:thioredoxin 1